MSEPVDAEPLEQLDEQMAGARPCESADGPEPQAWAKREGFGLALIDRGVTAAELERGRPYAWQEAVADGRLNRRAVWQAQPVYDTCPTCSTTGPKVYVAAEHSLGIACQWMMKNVHRCAEHDELLLPDETGCPTPDVPDHWQDPHNRFTGRAS